MKHAVKHAAHATRTRAHTLKSPQRLMTATTELAAAAAAPPHDHKEQLHAASHAASSSAQNPRPLLVAWPQVKAFVAMAQEALRAKAVAHEV